MHKYFMIVTVYGLQGGHYYKTEAEAQAAADLRNALYGCKLWMVREIFLRDSYADDTRPYITMKRA